MQYSAVIVDDEKKSRDGLIRHIDWGGLHFREPFQAADGIEALELMKHESVDLLITDIRMPYMDGLELVGKVNTLYPDIGIIVLSGFSEFEYAKRAMAYGVKHYLTKPTDLNQLVSVLKQCYEQLQQRDWQQLRVKRIEKKYKDTLEVMAEQFLLEVAEGERRTMSSIADFMQDHHLQMPYEYFRLMTLIPTSTKGWKGQKLQMYRTIRHYTEALSIQVFPFSRKQNDGIHLLVNCDQPRLVQQIAQELARSMLDADERPAAVYLSEPFGDLTAMMHGYQQIIQMLQQLPLPTGGHVYYYSDVLQLSLALLDLTYPYEVERQFVHTIVAGKAEEAYSAIEQMFSHLQKRKAPMETYREWFARVYFAVETAVHEFHVELSDMSGIRIFPLQKASEMRQPHELILLLKQFAERCIVLLQQYKSSSSDKWVEQAKQYIDLQYMNDITLQSAAAAVHISPTYLSKIFKKKTGLGFIEYLTEVRVQKAKDLLGDINIKIYEISDFIGYRSTKHFSQVFKSYTGLTPTEYRDSIRMTEDSQCSS